MTSRERTLVDLLDRLDLAPPLPELFSLVSQRALDQLERRAVPLTRRLLAGGLGAPTALLASRSEPRARASTHPLNLG